MINQLSKSIVFLLLCVFTFNSCVKSNTRDESKVLSVEQIGNLTPEQIQAIQLEQIQSLSPVHIKMFSQEQIQHFTKKQIQAFTNKQIRILSPEQVQALTPKQISFFTTEQVPYLDVLYLEVQDLTVDQIQTLSKRQIQSSFSLEDILFMQNKFTPWQLQFITEKQRRSIPLEEMRILTTEEMKDFKAEEVQFLVSQQIKWLNKRAISLKSKGYFTPKNFSDFNVYTLSSPNLNRVNRQSQIHIQTLGSEIFYDFDNVDREMDRNGYDEKIQVARALRLSLKENSVLQEKLSLCQESKNCYEDDEVRNYAREVRARLIGMANFSEMEVKFIRSSDTTYNFYDYVFPFREQPHKEEVKNVINSYFSISSEHKVRVLPSMIRWMNMVLKAYKVSFPKVMIDSSYTSSIDDKTSEEKPRPLPDIAKLLSWRIMEYPFLREKLFPEIYDDKTSEEKPKSPPENIKSLSGKEYPIWKEKLFEDPVDDKTLEKKSKPMSDIVEPFSGRIVEYPILQDKMFIEAVNLATILPKEYTYQGQLIPNENIDQICIQSLATEYFSHTMRKYLPIAWKVYVLSSQMVAYNLNHAVYRYFYKYSAPESIDFSKKADLLKEKMHSHSWYMPQAVRAIIQHLNHSDSFLFWMIAKLVFDTMAQIGYGNLLYTQPELSFLNNLLSGIRSIQEPTMTHLTDQEFEDFIKFVEHFDTISGKASSMAMEYARLSGNKKSAEDFVEKRLWPECKTQDSQICEPDLTENVDALANNKIIELLVHKLKNAGSLQDIGELPTLMEIIQEEQLTVLDVLPALPLPPKNTWRGLPVGFGLPSLRHEAFRKALSHKLFKTKNCSLNI